jgi:glutamate synthase domain-containing protein 2
VAGADAVNAASAALIERRLIPMDYYQSVVVHYLRADRALFVNTECCIQLNQSKNPEVGTGIATQSPAISGKAAFSFVKSHTVPNFQTSPSV